jgi:hypothetical protein
LERNQLETKQNLGSGLDKIEERKFKKWSWKWNKMERETIVSIGNKFYQRE